MKKLSIERLVEKYPNDQDLGSKIREMFNNGDLDVSFKSVMSIESSNHLPTKTFSIDLPVGEDKESRLTVHYGNDSYSIYMNNGSVDHEIEWKGESFTIAQYNIRAELYKKMLGIIISKLMQD